MEILAAESIEFVSTEEISKMSICFLVLHGLSEGKGNGEDEGI
jgi:hypothetical protein